MKETITTDPETGGQKAQKPIQLGAIDPIALLELGRVAAMGAEKYDAFNYLKGFDWRLHVDAAMRHLLLFWLGEDRDEESGAHHCAHAAWHLLGLVSQDVRGIGTDTRPVVQMADWASIDDMIDYVTRNPSWVTTDNETVTP